MKKILNKRLETLSAFIEENETVLDIGCDHGLLGIYLTLNRSHIKVISSDINEKPLNKAKENIHKFNLDEKIETRLGDGLEVMTSDITTIVISGMGGLSIINILKNINQFSHVTKLVLSPNSDFYELRKEISQLGFQIKKEEMVLESNKFYLITEFVKGEEQVDYYFGKLDLKNDIVKKYYNYIYEKNTKILKNFNILQKLRKKSLISENKKIKRNIIDMK